VSVRADQIGDATWELFPDLIYVVNPVRSSLRNATSFAVER